VRHDSLVSDGSCAPKRRSTRRSSPLDDEDALYWFTNLAPRQTGLPFVIWVSPRMAARHGIRVKVSRGPVTSIPEMTTVAIEPRVCLVRGRMNARDVSLLRAFVELNRDVLVKHWNHEIDSSDVIQSVKPINTR
jgi:hypothetical protein